MSDLNPDGAYLIRVGATKAFVLSLKYRDHKDNQFKVADYRIKSVPLSHSHHHYDHNVT